jgi:isochorismate pyruvate lyase
MVGLMAAANENELAKFRAEIDRIDSEIVKLLAERRKVVNGVIAVKTKSGLPAFIPERVEEVAERVRAEARRLGAPPDLAERVWRNLMDWVIAYEEKQLNDKK